MEGFPQVAAADVSLAGGSCRCHVMHRIVGWIAFTFSGSLFSLKGSGELGDLGLSMFIDSPCPDKDNPVKGLSTECSARSLASRSC